jgi:hypothetical protein
MNQSAVILKFFDADVDPDPESGSLFDPGPGMEKIQIRDKHPRSTTLRCARFYLCFVQDIESQRDRYKAHVTSLIKELQQGRGEQQPRVLNHLSAGQDQVDAPAAPPGSGG